MQIAPWWSKLFWPFTFFGPAGHPGLEDLLGDRRSLRLPSGQERNMANATFWTKKSIWDVCSTADIFIHFHPLSPTYFTHFHLKSPKITPQRRILHRGAKSGMGLDHHVGSPAKKNSFGFSWDFVPTRAPLYGANKPSFCLCLCLQCSTNSLCK